MFIRTFMSNQFRKNLQQKNTDELEKQLFEERAEMVEFAEDNGQWQLFDDKQSIGSMREAISNLPESETKMEIKERFDRVETIYEVYSARVVSETVGE